MEIATKRTRNTIQRKAVQEAIHALAGRHPTASEVYAWVRIGYPQLSLATVYRALHALVEQQAITEIRVDTVARYDVGMTDHAPQPLPHHHVICRVCGSVTDIGAAALPLPFLQAVEEATEGFTLDFFPIQFQGVCAPCRTTSSPAL